MHFSNGLLTVHDVLVKQTTGSPSLVSQERKQDMMSVNRTAARHFGYGQLTFSFHVFSNFELNVHFGRVCTRLSRRICKKM